MYQECKGCKFAAVAGCTAGVCAVVRSRIRGEGRHFPPGGLQLVAPERQSGVRVVPWADILPPHNTSPEPLGAGPAAHDTVQP